MQYSTINLHNSIIFALTISKMCSIIAVGDGMKVVDFSKISELKFAICDMSVIYQTPAWSTLSGGKRILNGFLLIDNGECKYEWQGVEATLQKGSLIYLPTGCEKTVTVTKRPFSFYRISFVLRDVESGEEIIFDENPNLFSESMSKSTFEICDSLLKSTLSENNTFLSMSLFCRLFEKIEKAMKPERDKRISKAIDYIDNYYTENTDVEKLSEMCFLSRAQMFRLFKKETGDTPVDYRNKLRIKKAQQLILDGECSVGEISEMLGFENIYYFSRLFKKYVGMPPSRYKKIF